MKDEAYNEHAKNLLRTLLGQYEKTDGLKIKPRDILSFKPGAIVKLGVEGQPSYTFTGSENVTVMSIDYNSCQFSMVIPDFGYVAFYADKSELPNLLQD